MREHYLKFLLTILCVFCITALCGFLIVHFYIKGTQEKGLKVQTYAVDDYSAKEKYNQNSVEFMLNTFLHSSTIYSPLCVENAYAYYAIQNDKEIDDIFYVFGNGFQDFQYSQFLLPDDSIKCFTVGIAKNQDSKADINEIPNDKLVLDEINAKFNTLSEGKIVFKVTPTNVFDYNIYSLCVIDTSILQECKEYADTYVVKGDFENYITDDLQYVVIPLEDADYELILKKGIDLYYDNKIRLYTTQKELTVILPKLNLESVENPSKYYTKTKLNEDFELDSTLTNVTTICHLNIHCQPTEIEIEVTDETLDFSQDSMFAIRNKQTGQLVLLGTVL